MVFRILLSILAVVSLTKAASFLWMWLGGVNFKLKGLE